MTILVTGAAGFIGFHIVKALTEKGKKVIGIDNLNDYYDVGLKNSRLSQLMTSPLFLFYKADIADQKSIQDICLENNDVTCVIHLAAQAGVRYSLQNPYSFEHSNLRGLLVLLESVRSLRNLQHFIFASSSSVYGNLAKLPYSIKDMTDKPVSFYGATKKSGEAICHSYAHLYGMPITSLRFFTVYGPWGRPDMAAHLFTKNILSGEPINVYNQGDMRRDFTYIDDCVAGVMACVDVFPVAIEGEALFSVFNIGNNRSEKLLDFISIIEDKVGSKAILNLLPIQNGDVRETFADIEESRRAFGFDPKTNIMEGLDKFVRWYRDYYKS